MMIRPKGDTGTSSIKVATQKEKPPSPRRKTLGVAVLCILLLGY
jgi:hypothetical protein